LPLKHKKFQRLILAFSSLLIIILIIFFPEHSLQAAIKGLDTWLKVVLPALLPFFIVTEIMVQSGLADFFSNLLTPLMRPLFNCPGHSSFVWIMSTSSGYPMGAKLIASLYEEGDITRAEGQRMLAFCNTSGPLFMIGAVGIGMLNSPQAGKIIAICHYLAALILGLLFRFYGREKKYKITYSLKPNMRSAINQLLDSKGKSRKSLGTILGDSVRSSMQAQLLIGGFIILFSVIINLIIVNGNFNIVNETRNNWTFVFSEGSRTIKALGAGLLEITTGCRLLSDTMLDMESKIIATSFIIGWGGLSIHSQAISLLANTDLSIGLYFFTKFLHGILSAILTHIFILFSPVDSIPAFSGPNYIINPTMYNTFIASLKLLTSAFFSLLAIYFLILLIKAIRVRD